MKQRCSSPAASASDRLAWQNYGFATAMLAAALVARWLMDPWLGHHMPLATMYVGVALAAWFGGWMPAAVVAIAGYLLSTWLFSAAAHATLIDSLGMPRLVLYSFSCTITVGLLESIRRAGRRHAASEARVVAIIEHMQECFCSLDSQWRIVAVNRVTEESLGRPRDALLHRSLWDVLPRWVGQPAESELRRAMQQRVPARFETPLFAPGSWHAVSAMPSDDGLSLFCQDITATRSQVDDLERQVAERTFALQQSVSELEAFSYTLVHDIRAPLRSISSFADILALDHAHQLDAEGRAHIARIQRSAVRMDQLIVDILDYSQLSRRKPDLRTIDVGDTVRELLRSQPEFHPERADIIIEGTLPKVLGNGALLAQCFTNLLHNAIKFVAPGVKPRIRISTHLGSGIARVNVTDNGIGIPADATARIFEPFRREHPHYDGTGIGLAIVRKVVEQMSGRVGVDSQVGRGSTFWVDLPLAPTPALTSATHTAAKELA